MTIRDFLTRWSFTSDDQAVSGLEKKLQHLTGQVDSLNKKMDFFVASQVFKSIVGLTQKFGRFAEEIKTSAVSAGVSVEEIQRLGFAAEQSGSSQDEMSASLTRLNRRLYDAKQGGEDAIKSFQDVGISSAQLQGFKNGGDALLALSDRFSEIQDPIKKVALSQDLLGRGGVRMIQFLSKGSKEIKKLGKEADRLNIVLSDGQTEASNTAFDSMNKLGAVVKGLGAMFASYLAPSFTDAINYILKFYEANKDLIDVNVRKWVWDTGFAFGVFLGILKVVAQAMIKFAEKLGIKDRLGEIAFVLLGASAAGLALTGVMKVMGIAFAGLMGPIKAVATAISMGRSAIMGIGVAIGLVQGVIASAVGWIATLTGSTYALAAATAIAQAPMWAIVAAIGAVIFVAHELFALFTGGNTWTGQIVEWLKGFEMMRTAIDTVKSAFESMMSALSDATKNTFLGKIITSFTGGPDGEAQTPAQESIKNVVSKAESVTNSVMNEKNIENIRNVTSKFTDTSTVENVQNKLFNEKNVQNLNNVMSNEKNIEKIKQVSTNVETVRSVAQTQPALSASSGPVSNNYSVNAPISVSVPAGSDPSVVGEKVKEGVREHLDRVHREMARGLQGAIAY